MQGRATSSLIDRIRTLHVGGTTVGLTDVQLLERFLHRRDSAAEAAFTALVERHGPMVHRVCQGVLREEHDADDAFQATFLILARKAGSIRERGSIASWLYGVARRVALRARAQRRLRTEREQAAGARATVRDSGMDQTGLSQDVLDEVDRLPFKYRSAIVLCDLDGLTQEEAARELGVPVGTVKVRLSRARQRLRGRLLRRGLAPALVGSATAARGACLITTPFMDFTVKAAMQVAAGQAATVSTSVALLVKGVLRNMFIAKLRTIIALAAGCLPLILATGWAIHSLPGSARSGQAAVTQAENPPLRVALEQPPGSPAQQQTSSTQPQPSPAQPVVVETLRKSSFLCSLKQEASLEPAEKVSLLSTISGTVARVYVELGDPVKKGQLLVQIDAPELVDDVEMAKAMVGREEARLTLAEKRIVQNNTIGRGE